MCWMALAPLGAALSGGALASTSAAAGVLGTTTALSFGTSAVGIIGQQQQARQQRRFQEAASIQEQIRARKEMTAIRIKQDQEMQAKQNELFALQQRAKASISRATVAAGEAGVSGSSVDLLLDDYYRQMGNYQYALTREQGFQNVATGLALDNVAQGSTQSLVNINRPVNSPSFIESVLTPIAAGVQGYSQGVNIARARGIPLTTDG